MNSILPSAKTVSKHTYILADDYRTRLSENLKDAYESGALTVTPDMWTDPHKQIAYIGASASFIDENFDFFSVDLFCQPFTEDDKSSDNIFLVLFHKF